jgi:hypothetical protein
MGAPFPPVRAPWISPNVGGVLGPRPGAPTQAYPILSYNELPASPAPYPALPAPPVSYPASSYSLDHSALIHGAFSNSHNAQPYGDVPWVMDSGASSHVTGKTGNLTTTHSNLDSCPSHIIVGNGSKFPILAVGSVQISSLLYTFKMCSFPPTLSRILFLFASSLVIIMYLLSLTLLVSP